MVLYFYYFKKNFMKTKIILVFLMIIGAHACAMDKMLTVFKPQQEYLSCKQSKFDDMNVQQLRVWHENLSDKQRDGIRKNLEKQGDVCKALFNFVIHMPQDIQKLIIAHMFDGFTQPSSQHSFGEYTDGINKFCEMPFYVACKSCAKAEKFLEHLKKDAAWWQ